MRLYRVRGCATSSLSATHSSASACVRWKPRARLLYRVTCRFTGAMGADDDDDDDDDATARLLPVVPDGVSEALLSSLVHC